VRESILRGGNRVREKELIGRPVGTERRVEMEKKGGL
jgi:hypothetical protein